MLLSLPLLETIITISFNHNTTRLVTFSNTGFPGGSFKQSLYKTNFQIS